MRGEQPVRLDTENVIGDSPLTRDTATASITTPLTTTDEVPDPFSKDAEAPGESADPAWNSPVADPSAGAVANGSWTPEIYFFPDAPPADAVRSTTIPWHSDTIETIRFFLLQVVNKLRERFAHIFNGLVRQINSPFHELRRRCPTPGEVVNLRGRTTCGRNGRVARNAAGILVVRQFHSEVFRVPREGYPMSVRVLLRYCECELCGWYHLLRRCITIRETGPSGPLDHLPSHLLAVHSGDPHLS